MSSFKPKNFESVLYHIGNQVDSMVECDVVRSIGGNFNTRGMSYISKHNPHDVGTVIVGEDDGAIAVDITTLDDVVTSFILKDENDKDGIENIAEWFQQHYSR